MAQVKEELKTAPSPPKAPWLQKVEDDARRITLRRIREQEEERKFREAKNQNESPVAEAEQA